MDKRTLYYLLGPKLRRVLRRTYYFPVDVIDRILGRRDNLTPPKGKVFVGSGDFIQQGKRLLNLLEKYGRLKPSHRVLDVGCGIGRVAVPLTKYLNKNGSYEGFDIVKSGILWCQKKISMNYSNFNFRHIDLQNDLYNLRTDAKAKNHVFPYDDNEFDLVYLFSVFTHMLPDDVENYIGQINRVLKHGGICFATFFIMNEQNKKLSSGNMGLKFKFDKGDHLLIDNKVKEANVAYKEHHLKQIFIENNFIIEDIHYGFWSGRNKDQCLNFQDIVILIK